MKGHMRLFRLVHGLMAFFFACAALMLITIATRMARVAFIGGLDQAAAQAISYPFLGLFAEVNVVVTSASVPSYAGM